MSTNDTREWISSSGLFRFGKHKDEPIEEVLKDDPRYIQWIIDEVENIDEGDRSMLSTLLAQSRKKEKR